MKETFGEYIRKLRTEEGLTLTQLAAKLELDSANLSKIETGKRDFSMERLEMLAKVFNLDLEILKNEYKSDKLAKHIYDLDCSSEVLKVAEEKAEYRKTLKK